MSRGQVIGRGGAVALSIVLLGFAGCAKPDNTPSRVASQATSSHPAAPSADPNAAPKDPPIGPRFNFDQAATFPDGMLVEVASVKSATASAQMRGAEDTNGHIVIADLLVINDTKGELSTDPIKVFGYYFSQVGARKIVDPTGTLGSGFAGTLQPGEQGRATMGFAIPLEADGDVTIMIDGGTGEHGPVQFAGAVD